MLQGEKTAAAKNRGVRIAFPSSGLVTRISAVGGASKKSWKMLSFSIPKEERVQSKHFDKKDLQKHTFGGLPF